MGVAQEGMEVQEEAAKSMNMGATLIDSIWPTGLINSIWPTGLVL